MSGEKRSTSSASNFKPLDFRPFLQSKIGTKEAHKLLDPLTKRTKKNEKQLNFGYFWIEKSANALLILSYCTTAVVRPDRRCFERCYAGLRCYNLQSRP